MTKKRKQPSKPLLNKPRKAYTVETAFASVPGLGIEDIDQAIRDAKDEKVARDFARGLYWPVPRRKPKS